MREAVQWQHSALLCTCMSPMSSAAGGIMLLHSHTLYLHIQFRLFQVKAKECRLSSSQKG